MKKFVLITLTSLITLILLSQAVNASFGKENNKPKNGKAEVKIEIKTNQGKVEKKIEIKQENKNDEIEDENENENKNRIRVRVEEDKGKFKIQGPIESFTESSVTIDERLIKIDPNTTSKFKQVGKLEVGMHTKVEGMIIDGTYFAEKIVVDQRNKHEIEEDQDEEVSSTATVTPTISIEPTTSVERTTTLSPTPTEGLTQTQEVESQFVLGQIIEALEKFLNSLKEISRI